MTLKFFDGFDNGTDRVNLEGDAVLSAAGGRRGSGAIHLQSRDYLHIPVVPETHATKEYYIGFAMYITSHPASTQSILQFGALDTSNPANGFRITSSGVIDTRFSNTYGASASTPLPVGEWFYLEFVIQKSNSGSVGVFLNGTSILSDTLDTSNGDGLIQIGGYYSPDWLIDDLYVCDSDGAAPFNTRLGDVYVKNLAPTGTGTYSAGVGSDGNSVDNYLLVDEVPPSSTDYVTLNNAADRDSYTVSALGAGEIPLAVRASVRVGEGGGLVSANPFIRLGTTDYDGDAEPVAFAYKWVDKYWETNPNTASAWVEDDLDGAEVGVERTQ